MAFVIRFAKGVRNHWKKSTFAAAAIGYGIKYAIDKNETNKLMRVYCEKAAEYGKQPISVNNVPRSITVILNPNANKRKATKYFEKYCAPILNLAGICVEIIQTESEGHARELLQTIAPTDAIVVAGGDGTLSEVVTGMLRLTCENKNNLLPIGVLPVGRTNTIAKNLFPGGDYLEDIKSLADASLAIIEELTKPVDVMKIEIVDPETTTKPVYALSGIEWGAYRDAQVKKDSYWYFGFLRKYATYIFNGYKNSLTWNCYAELKYSEPCNGCLNCYVDNESTNRRWYHKFLSKKGDGRAALLSNERCGMVEEKISTADLSILTSNVINKSTDEVISDTIDGPPKLTINVGPENIKYFDFVTEGWKNENGRNRKVINKIEAKQIEIQPSVPPEKESFFWIDKEEFEVKPIKISLLPNYINMFTKKSNVIV